MSLAAVAVVVLVLLLLLQQFVPEDLVLLAGAVVAEAPLEQAGLEREKSIEILQKCIYFYRVPVPLECS